MTATFIQSKVGDIIYYVIVEKSRMITKGEIKTGVITEILKSDTPYHLTFKLNNGITLEVNNWNCSTTKEEIINDGREIYADGIINPFYFIMFSTNEHELRKKISECVENEISRLGSLSIDIQNELVRLAGMRTMIQALHLTKVEKIVLEPTIV